MPLPRRFRGSSALVLSLSWLVACAATSPARGELPNECDLGVAFALQGRLAAADSAFTSLLSHSPGDSRALTNLGNIRLLRGEREVALGFYESAARADSADAGILRNRAIALYLMGRDSLAQASAAEAVARSGGIVDALALVGIPSREAGDPENKAADMSAVMQFPIKPAPGQRTRLTRLDVIELAHSSPAARNRDHNTSRATTAAGPNSTHPARENSPVTKTGANAAREALAAEAPAGGATGSSDRNAAAALYWKR